MKKHIVFFSGGKDSTALLLMMLEKDMQVDEIVFCDTTMDFPEMYEHIRKVEKYINQKVTTLKSEKSFKYYMFDHQKVRGKFKGELGYGWPRTRQRWCTWIFKIDLINKYISKNSIEYIGIASNEKHRCKGNGKKKYPLVDWGITGKEALQYCYDKGFDWGGLYKHFDRVSCWCCPMQGLKALKNLYYYFPDLWKELKEIDAKAVNNFRCDYTLNQLEKRFSHEIWLEEHQIKLQF